VAISSISNIQDVVVNKGEGYNYDVSPVFNDSDGDTLKYSATLKDGGDLPTWLYIDVDTGVLSGTPDNDAKGEFNITVKAFDLSGDNASLTFNLTVGTTWGEYDYLTSNIELAQAATVKITKSTAVMISDRYAITAAHSPLDANNEITPNLEVKNIWGEVREIINVYYDVDADFAIVELESPFEHSYSVKIADTASVADDPVFIVGHPKTIASSGLGWAVAFGTAYGADHDGGYLTYFDLDVIGGFSGSGIYNDQGELVSVLSGSNTNYLPDYGSVYFNEEFTVHNEIWNDLNGWAALGVKLDFILPFLEQYSINNVLQDNPTLPDNRPDPEKIPFVDDAALLTIESIAQASRLSTVAITPNNPDNASDFRPNGSGVIISDNLILTNAHVVEGKDSFTIGFAYEELISGAITLAVHPTRDLALIKLPNSIPDGYLPVNLASTEIQNGEAAYVIGNPDILWDVNGGWIVSAAQGEGVDKGDLNLTGIASGGNSGGPIFDINGDLAGITWGGGTGWAEDLNDRQDPHATDFSPTVQPLKSNVIGVDFSIIREFVSEYIPESNNDVGEFNYIYDSIIDLQGNIIVVGRKKYSNDNDILIKSFDSTTLSDIPNDYSTLFRTENSNEIIRHVVQQADGSLLFVGSNIKDGNSSIQVTRISADGSLDANFGMQGQVNVANNGYWDTGQDIVVLENGNILISGTRKAEDVTDFIVVRLNSDGTIDTSFANNGTAVIDFGDSSDFAKSMIVQDDGSIVVAGFSDNGGDLSDYSKTNDFAMVRLLQGGSLDESFGQSGYVLTDFGDSDYASEVVIQADGKILVAGFGYMFPEGYPVDFPAMLLARYNTNGTLDTTFGSNGYTFHNSGIRNEHGKAIALTPEGQILMTGDVYVGAKTSSNNLSTNGDYDIGIIRFNTDGSLDESFGNNGLITIDAQGNESVENIHVKDDQIIVTGYSDKVTSVDPVVITLDLDGNLTAASDVYKLTDIYNAYDLVYANNEPQGYVYVTGIPVPGSQLQASVNFDNLSEVESLNYQWFSNGILITDSISKTYDLVSDDIGKELTFVATYIDSNNNSYQLDSKSIQVVEEYVIPESDIQNIDFNIYYDKIEQSPFLNSSLQLGDSIKSVYIHYMQTSNDFSYEWSSDLEYNPNTGLFEIEDKLNPYLNSGLYEITFVEITDTSNNTMRVTPNQLRALGHDIQTSLYNPNGDSQAPQLLSVKLGEWFVDTDNDEFVIPILGSATDYNGSGFQSENIRVFMNTPNSEGLHMNVLIQDDGSFSGNIRLSLNTPSGNYSISHVDLTDKAGNWQKFSSINQSVNIINENSDDIAPVLSDFDMYAIFDTESGRPKIIMEGMVKDEIAGFKEVFTRLYGPQGEDYIGLGWEHDTNSNLNFKIELNLLSEYLPGTYTIKDMHIYDNAFNTTNIDDIDFDTLGSLKSINVFFPTSNEDAVINATESDDFVFGSNETSNELNAGAGNDYVFSGEGDDIINAGSGNDTIILTTDNVWDSSIVAKNVSNDSSTGTNEKISLAGLNRFSDVIDGGADVDTINLTDGNDAFFIDDVYSEHHSSLTLTSTTQGVDSTARVVDLEVINAGEGNDIVDLTSTNFVLATAVAINGEAGNDNLWGSNGSDIIDGGTGDDSIFGGTGADTLTGGTGADIFQFTATAGSDVITDFDVGGDSIELYYRAEDNHTNADLSLASGILTWDVDSTSNDVVIDLSDTINSSDLNDLDALITFVEIV